MKKKKKTEWFVFTKDDDGHDYLIPSFMKDEFHRLEEDGWDDNFEEFIDKFDEYRINSYYQFEFQNPRLIGDEDDED